MATISKREKLEKLARISNEDVPLIYYRCIGKKPAEIAQTLHLGTSQSVYNRFTKIFSDLEIKGDDKEDQLITEYSPIFLEFVTSEDDLNNWGHIRAKMLREASSLGTEPELPEGEEANKPVSIPDSLDDENKPTGAKANQDEPVRRSRPSWIVVSVSLLVACLLCTALGIVGWRLIPGFLNSSQSTQIPLPQITDTKAAMQQPTNTMLPIFTPTSTFTDTPVPTDTLVPTNTPIPSPTLVPTQPPTFFDDFENGLNPAWTVVYGKPTISDGQLAAGEETLLSVGDPTWTDYQVEFDVWMGRFTCQDALSSFLGVRATDIDNMLQLRFHTCETEWSSFINGTQSVIPNTFDGNQGFGETFVHFIVTAEGDRISVHVQSISLNSFIDTDHPSGNIYLRIRNATLYDNFKITLLNP